MPPAPEVIKSSALLLVPFDSRMPFPPVVEYVQDTGPIVVRPVAVTVLARFRLRKVHITVGDFEFSGFLDDRTIGGYVTNAA